MYLIVAVDDTGGMLFNGRRQTMDRAMRAKLLEKAQGHLLYVAPYTAQLFSPEEQKQLHVSDTFLKEAGAGDWAWTEKEDPTPYLSDIEKLILVRWNRTYPADQWLTLDINTKWKRECVEDFAGSSHENITWEVYGR